MKNGEFVVQQEVVLKQERKRNTRLILVLVAIVVISLIGLAAMTGLYIHAKQTKPAAVKGGRCPRPVFGTIPECKDRPCSADSDCKKGTKCCTVGMCEGGKPRCVKAVRGPYPIVCPKSDGVVCDVKECDTHRDCKNKYKCCVNDCGSTLCIPNPKEVTPPKGSCPKLPPGTMGLCVEDCFNCAADERCCSNGCGHTCMKVV